MSFVATKTKHAVIVSMFDTKDISVDNVRGKLESFAEYVRGLNF